MNQSSLLLFCSLLYLVLGYAPKEPLVNTKNGPIKGKTYLSHYGRPYDGFKGIPFAKPPTGQLRFKAPEPADPWEFALDATKDGPYCIQKNFFFENPKVEGQEDCLYLNVYVPENCSVKLLPVMVFIHWGGFLAGRGTSDYLGPDYFMDKNVILVTFNYRLGVLGFLTTLDDEAPGNYGLKDQVAALRWVQENIESFGGDKNDVTIFGQSAGSGSVHYHLLSPLSKGLFHKAISQSGSALDLWAKPGNSLQPTVLAAQASFVGCESHLNNSNLLLSCLRNVSAEDLVDSSSKFQYFKNEPLTAYTTVVETLTTRNPEPFFAKEPLEYIQNAEFANVPWIIGGVQEEGILKAAPLLRQETTRKEFNEKFEVLFPQMLGLALSVGPDTTSLFNNITDKYLEGKKQVDINDANSIQGLIDLYTDRSFAYGTYQSVMLHSLKGHNPIWFYNFAYRGQLTYGDLFAATSENIPNYEWGVSHCDDLLYLFKSPALLPDLTDQADLSLSKVMLDLWTNFSIYGDPTPDNSGCLFEWPEVNLGGEMRNENLVFLNITGSCKSEPYFEIATGFHPDRMRFWSSQPLLENFPGLN